MKSLFEKSQVLELKSAKCMKFFRNPFIATCLALSFLFVSCSKDSLLAEGGKIQKSSSIIQRGDYTEHLELFENAVYGLNAALNNESVSKDYNSIHNYVMNYLNANTTVPNDYTIDMDGYNETFSDLVQLKLVNSSFITTDQANLLNQFYSDVTSISGEDSDEILSEFDALLDELESDLNQTDLNEEQAQYFSVLLTSMQTGGYGTIGVLVSYSAVGCAGAALGVIGLTAAIVTAPVTGGLSVWAYVGVISGGLSTGLSIADCFPL